MFSPSTTHVLSIFVLLGLAFAGIFVWYRLAVSGRPSVSVPQIFMRVLNLFLARILWRAEVSGPFSIQGRQGAVVVCNHRSPSDPAFIALAADQVIHWMVAKEYCTHPALAWLFRILEVIPVNRSGIDTSAVKRAIRLVQEGGIVGVFPEGRINVSDDLLMPGRSGAALIALKARVPIIPCYISGSPYKGSIYGCLLLPARTRLIVGNPVDISDFFGQKTERKTLEQITHRMLVEIARLAGYADYPVKSAGRAEKSLDKLPRPQEEQEAVAELSR